MEECIETDVDIPLNLKLALSPGVFATCRVPLKPYVWLVNACHGPEYTILSLKSSIVTLSGQSAIFVDGEHVNAAYSEAGSRVVNDREGGGSGWVRDAQLKCECSL